MNVARRLTVIPRIAIWIQVYLMPFTTMLELVKYVNETQDLPTRLCLTGDIVSDAKTRYDAGRFRKCQLRRFAKISANGATSPLDEFIVRTETFLDMCIEMPCSAADDATGDGRPTLK
jgi:hypothetical protein